MLSAYIEWVTRHAGRVVLAVVLVSALLISRAASLKIEVNPDSQLPQDHPYIQALNLLHEIFGEKNLVFIGLFPREGDIYTPAFLATLKRVTDRIASLPGLVPRTYLSLALSKAADIRGTDERMSVRPFLDPLPRTREEALAVRQRVEANPQYVGTIVAARGEAAGIVADFEFTKELPGYPEIEAAVRHALVEEADGSFTAHLGGPAIYVAWLAYYSARMFYFFPLALAVIGLVHYEAFRTVQAIFLPLLTAFLAMLWSLALLGLLGVALDPFNVTTPILILAVAAGHAVQMLKRFYEELEAGGDQREAVVRSIVKVGPVMIIAAVIAALSFLSLVTFHTAAIRNFGVFTALGILSALVIEMTLIPAVRCLLPAPAARERSRQQSAHVFDRLVGPLGPFLARGGWLPVLIGAGVVAAVSALAATRLTIDSSFRRQFFPSATVHRDDVALNAAFAGTSTLVLLIEGAEDGAIDDPALLRGIDELERWFEAEPRVGKALSYVDFVKRMHAAMSGGGAGAPGLPESKSLVAQYLLLYSLSGSVEDFDSLVDPGHRVCAVRVYLKDDSTLFADALVERMRQRLAALLPPGYRTHITGSLASSDAMNEVMVHGKVRNIAQIASIILVIASLALRSLVGGLFVALPLALAVATNFGVMGLASIPLDIGTSTISAMAVGIGADYAIYFLFRLREELATDGDLEAALDRTLRTSGKAILFVSSAIAAGYLTLCFSGFAYHIRLGTLVALAMVVSSVASLTVLPALVLVFRPSFLQTAGRGIEAERPAPDGRGVS
jgi:hypothetical protein